MEAAVEGLRKYVEFLRSRVGGGGLLEFLEGELERALAWARLRTEGCRVVLRLADGAPAYRASAAVEAIFVLDGLYRPLRVEVEVKGGEAVPLLQVAGLWPDSPPRRVDGLEVQAQDGWLVVRLARGTRRTGPPLRRGPPSCWTGTTGSWPWSSM